LARESYEPLQLQGLRPLYSYFYFYFYFYSSLAYLSCLSSLKGLPGDPPHRDPASLSNQGAKETEKGGGRRAYNHREDLASQDTPV
jgi:hypothetical protein